MIAPGNSVVELALGLAFVIATGYAIGRVHQWYRYGTERDQSYRDGYGEASQSMFDMAVRTRTDAARAAAVTQSIPQPYGHAPTLVGTTRRRIVTAAARHVA